MNLRDLDELGLLAQLIIEASAQSISLTAQKPAPSRWPIVGVKSDERVARICEKAYKASYYTGDWVMQGSQKVGYQKVPWVEVGEASLSIGRAYKRRILDERVY